MSRLSEKTIDEMNDKVNFTKAFTAVDSLYEARSHLNDEVINNLKRLVKKLDAITEGAVDEEGAELFDMADEHIESVRKQIDLCHKRAIGANMERPNVK